MGYDRLMLNLGVYIFIDHYAYKNIRVQNKVQRSLCIIKQFIINTYN